MKKVLTTIALSLTTVMAASAAMAGPGPDHRFDPRKAPPPPVHVVKNGAHFKHTPPPVHANKHHDNRFNDKRQFKRDDFRVGQTLPRAFDSKRFEIKQREVRGFKAGKNEQWYKVNGDYLLVNEKNNRILRVI